MMNNFIVCKFKTLMGISFIHLSNNNEKVESAFPY